MLKMTVKKFSLLQTSYEYYREFVCSSKVLIQKYSSSIILLQFFTAQHGSENYNKTLSFNALSMIDFLKHKYSSYHRRILPQILMV